MYFLSLTPNMPNTLDIHYPTDLVKSEDKTLKLSSFNKLQYCKPDPKVIFVSGAGVTKSVEKGKRIISADESLRRKLIS
jgi:hypothetical protein